MCVPSFVHRRALPKTPISSSKQLLLSLPPLKFDAAAFFYPPLQQQQQLPEEIVSDGKRQTHIVVQHDYHDRATETVDFSIDEVQTTRGGVAVPFPPKLHEMLQQVEEESLEHIVSWQPHGRCFLVHDPKGFVDIVLPKYFKQSKLASFQRQLNLYGFQRLTKGNDKGGYYHEYFLRGRVDLCSKIHRVKVKGTGVRARSNPDAEPDLWKMSWINTGDGIMARHPQQQQLQQQGAETTMPASVSLDSSMDSAGSANNNKDLFSLQTEAEDLLFFEGRAFHALESEPPPVHQPVSPPSPLVADSLDFDSVEIDSLLLADIKLPENFHLDIIDSIDDDVAFGNLLERLIDEQ